MDEERMRPGHRLVVVLCVSFIALTLTVGSQKGRPDHEKPVPLIPRGSVPEQVEGPRGKPADPGSSGKMTVK